MITKDLETQQITVTENSHIYKQIEDNLQTLTTIFQDSADFIAREITITMNPQSEVAAYLFYIDGLANTELINSYVLKEIMNNSTTINSNEFIPKLKDSLVKVTGIKEVSNFRNLLDDLFTGNTVLLVDQFPIGLSISTPGWKERSIDQPETQTVIRGPRDSFNENIRTNTSLIRRRIKTENLTCVEKTIGRITKTNVTLMYIKGLINPTIITEVESRLNRIDIDGIMDGGNIEDFIQDDHFTVFPTMFITERPDIASSALLDGRFIIIVDGSPTILVAPTVFSQFFISPEDYYQRWNFSTLITILRYACFFIALLSPALYIALTTYHQEMIPTHLLMSIAAQREGLPFPAFTEVLILQFAFEILRESGLRMPKQIGQALSIVGALVIGQASVSAGFVSPANLIIVSITAIASFIFPAYSMSIPVRILMFLFMFLGGFMGVYGITLGLILVVLHMCSLRSFGVPYMYPFGPFNFTAQKDTVLKLPIWSLRKRPEGISKRNPTRNRTPFPGKPRKE